MVYLAVVVALALLGLLVWGVRLPMSTHATRDMLINAPAEQVWSVMTDFLRQVEWRSDLKSLEMAGVSPGQEAWLERPRRGRPSAMRVTRQKVKQLMEIERLPNGFCSGTWSLALESAAQATRVTLAETLHVANPVARVYARLFLDRAAALELYLRDLKQRAETSRSR